MTTTTDTKSDTNAPPLDTWAVVELMGHVRIAGRLTEESHFGVALGRLDVPMGETEFATQFFGGSSIYRVTPCSEQIAREVAKEAAGHPISPWSLRHLLPKPDVMAVGPRYGRDDDDAPF